MESYQTRYLELLRQSFPTHEATITELINLDAILHLPKGTELYLSDIHGEAEAFRHILRTGSGNIKEQLFELFHDTLTSTEINHLAILIAYPENVLTTDVLFPNKTREWYRETIHHLIEMVKFSSIKYTRSKVRKSLPKNYGYIIEELLYVDRNGGNKETYYQQVITNLIDLGEADPFIIGLANTIQRLIVDHLHVVGDIYDRGAGPHLVMDTLVKHHSVDIQWGNHDILWIGAFFGSKACLLNLLRIAARYDYLLDLESSYALNLRSLFRLAETHYTQNPAFIPKAKKAEEPNRRQEQADMNLVHQALTIMQFKVESQLIKRRPEFKMDARLLLDEVDYDQLTLTLDGQTLPIEHACFQTIDPKNPDQLTSEEAYVIDTLMESFQRSKKLQQHINFLMKKGSMYLVYNQQLLYHGCIPLDPAGNFLEFSLNGHNYYGKALLDFFDAQIRLSANHLQVGDDLATDLIWYAWAGICSPLFGKSKMATFERYFLSDPNTHVEVPNSYYSLRNHKETCQLILANFGLNPNRSAIINGHTPVKVTQGESPIKAEGKLFVIDGGLCKAYQKTTGIAGYSLLNNSYGFQVVTHSPFTSICQLLKEGQDKTSLKKVIDTELPRRLIADTTIGEHIKEQMQTLRELLTYQQGLQ